MDETRWVYLNVVQVHYTACILDEAARLI
jgi:hypothetical protein